MSVRARSCFRATLLCAITRAPHPNLRQPRSLLSHDKVPRKKEKLFRGSISGNYFFFVTKCVTELRSLVLRARGLGMMLRLPPTQKSAERNPPPPVIFPTQSVT